MLLVPSLVRFDVVGFIQGIFRSQGYGCTVVLFNSVFTKPLTPLEDFDQEGYNVRTHLVADLKVRSECRS